MRRDPRLLVVPLAYLYVFLPSVPYVGTIALPFVQATVPYLTMAVLVSVLALLRSPSPSATATRFPWWMLGAAAGSLVLLALHAARG